MTPFVEKMKNEGYTIAEKTDNLVLMNGKFADNNGAEIIIVATPQSGIVWQVIVLMDKSSSWKTLKSDYFKYKELFNKKYSSYPFKEYEFFSDPYSEGDGFENQALRHDKCTYFSYWKLPEGDISVSISKTEKIKFTYEDKIGSDLDTKEKEENTLSDI